MTGNTHPPYLTVYYAGIEDFAGDEALGYWRDKDRVIVKEGRYWREGHGVPGGGRFRLRESLARASCHVSPEAIPYLAHRGVVLATGRAPSSGGRAAALSWWRDVHLPDLFAVDGVLAVMGFDPTDPSDDRLLHLVLLEDDPAVVMVRIEAARRYDRAIGRYPAHGGVYEPELFLPYRTIVPYEYDFRW